MSEVKNLKKNDSKTNRLNITLSDKLKEKLVSFSDETGITQNNIIAQALVDYFQKYEMLNSALPALIQGIVDNPKGLFEFGKMIETNVDNMMDDTDR